MLGFLIGAVCLVGLIKTLRWGRGRLGGGCYGGGCGGYSRSHHGRWGGHHGGLGGSRWWLRALFERLDTSPGQEKAIVSAIEELMGVKQEVREELGHTRKDAARAVRGDVLDEAALREAFGRQDTLLAKVREAAVEALRKIH